MPSTFLNAILSDDPAALRELFELGSSLADFNAAFGRPAIFEAIDAGALQAAAILVSYGADPNALDEQGQPLSHRLVSAQASDEAAASNLEALLAIGADPNARAGESRESLLHLCSRLGLPKAVGALLDRGAALDAQDALGLTPLMSALDRSAPCAEAASLLILAGADLAARDARGRSPADIARERGETEVARAMERAQERFELIESSSPGPGSNDPAGPARARL